MVSPNGGLSDLPEPYAIEGGNALHAVMVVGVADPGKLTGRPPTEKFAIRYVQAHQILVDPVVGYCIAKPSP